MKIGRVVVLFALGIILGGCARDGGEGDGKVRITFSADSALDKAVVSRADGDGGDALAGLADMLPENPEEYFSLTIEDAKGKLVGSWESVSAFPSDGIWLNPGTYTATAFRDGEVIVEDFDSPRFGATKSFAIQDGVTSPIELTARLLNMAVTVECTPFFEGYFREYNVKLVRGDETVIDFSEQGDSMAAFVEPLSCKVVVSCVRQNGKPFNREFNLADHTETIAACTHQRIVLDVNEGDGGSAAFEISFNGNVEVVQVDTIDVGGE